MCFCCHLSKFEAEFDANPLCIHIIHFSRLVRSLNSTNMMSKKCTEKNMPAQDNAAWQIDSQRELLAIPSSAQLYCRRFSHVIQISGTFGQHLISSGQRGIASVVGKTGQDINPLNAGLNPVCKSQLAEFFCRVFKFCSWYSKNQNISRTKRDKFVTQKAFCGEGNRHCSVCYQMLQYSYMVMEKICFWKKLVNIHVVLLTLWSRLHLFGQRTDE